MENEIKAYVFYVVPYSFIDYSKRNNQKFFIYKLNDGNEWDKEKMEQKIRDLKFSNFKTQRIELVKKIGTKIEVIKEIPLT
ncbi:MAG: hypothetical protein QXD55_01905 [Candidatus Aenigmatarchaeota archaeon]